MDSVVKDDHRSQAYLGVAFAEYAFPLIVALGFCILTILRRRRVSPLLKRPFTLLFISLLLFFL
jgi:hypothetical protein